MAFVSDSIKVEQKTILGCLVEVRLFLAGDDAKVLLWVIRGLTGMRQRLPSAKIRLPAIRELKVLLCLAKQSVGHIPLPKTGLFLYYCNVLAFVSDHAR